MANYALLDENNIVVSVITAPDEGGDIDWEIEHEKITGYKCKRTSFNTFGGQHLQGGQPFRMNYASAGYTYDEDRDAFIPEKDFPSWILDETTCRWVPPVELEQDAGPCYWDEETVSWIPYEPLDNTP